VEQSPPSEAKSHSARQEILHLLWNTKADYHVHKSPLLVPILCQMNPVHIAPPHFSKTHSNIILSSMTRSSKWNEALHYAVFSNFSPLPLRLIFSSTPCYQIPSIYDPPLVWETKFHTHTKQEVKSRFWKFQYLNFWERKWKDKRFWT